MADVMGCVGSGCGRGAVGSSPIHHHAALPVELGVVRDARLCLVACVVGSVTEHPAGEV